MHHTEVPLKDDSIGTAILLTGLFFAFLVSCVIYFVILYRKRQLKNQKEQEEREAFYQREILKTQIEIQEQTLENISKEIHDNVTQVLSFIKLSLGSLVASLDESRKLKLSESRELLSQTINDLRDLSKSMSFEHIKSIGLIRTFEKEVERMNKSGIIDVHFINEGEIYSLGEQKELVLFRIMQESINNALKHSGAKNIYINAQYKPNDFVLVLRDDGSGFTPAELDNKSGSGLRNIENRAAMIDGRALIESSPGKGCVVTVTVNTSK